MIRNKNFCVIAKHKLTGKLYLNSKDVYATEQEAQTAANTLSITEDLEDEYETTICQIIRPGGS